jgi:hypothetical protein
LHLDVAADVLDFSRTGVRLIATPNGSIIGQVPFGIRRFGQAYRVGHDRGDMLPLRRPPFHA